MTKPAERAMDTVRGGMPERATRDRGDFIVVEKRIGPGRVFAGMPPFTWTGRAIMTEHSG